MNDNIQRKKELEDRTIEFSVLVVKTLGKYNGLPTLKPLIIQVIRSSSSIGANYAEANNASSRADFKNKLYIAKKEAAETLYWFRVLTKLIPDENLKPLIKEVTSLYLILQKATNTLRQENEK